MLFRSRPDTKKLPIDDDTPVFAHDDNADAVARRDLNTVLDAVPARTSDLIRRTKVDGQSVAEAAAANNMSETAAKVSIHRGLKALAARFAGGLK